MNLEKPLLSHAWSAAFSFSKCHIEETTPYDPFTPYIMAAEQFPRFARCVCVCVLQCMILLWNRLCLTISSCSPTLLQILDSRVSHQSDDRAIYYASRLNASCLPCFRLHRYDVYTPSRNIVYHDYKPSDHGMSEWFKQRRGRLRQESLDRIKSFLHIPGVEETSETALANLGIYGLGKRRSLSQLMDFVGIDLNTMKVDKKVRSISVLVRE